MKQIISMSMFLAFSSAFAATWSGQAGAMTLDSGASTIYFAAFDASKGTLLNSFPVQMKVTSGQWEVTVPD